MNIGSVAGRNAGRGTLTHSLTKAAVAQLTRLMAADLAPRVRVNGVLPGAVETAALRRWVAPEIRETMAAAHGHAPQRHPRGHRPRRALPRVARRASWVTGKLLEVDGLAGEDLVPKDIPDL